MSNSPHSFISAKPCRYYQSGYCWRADNCRFYHQDLSHTSSFNQHPLPIKPSHCLPPFDNLQISFHDPSQASQVASTSTSTSSSTQSVPKPIRPEKSPEDTCGICLELPNTYYGLLSSCSHIFCLTCIRNWRQSKGKTSDQISLGILRRCPLCRVESTFLVPSWTFYGDGPEKAELIELAKSKWSQNPCKHLQRFRDCPFGRECFYKHVDHTGLPITLTHTHQEWLNNRESNEFPGMSLATRASRHGLDPMYMLARLLLSQPLVRDYLIRVTGARSDDVDQLLARFASGEVIEDQSALLRVSALVSTDSSDGPGGEEIEERGPASQERPIDEDSGDELQDHETLAPSHLPDPTLVHFSSPITTSTITPTLESGLGSQDRLPDPTNLGLPDQSVEELISLSNPEELTTLGSSDDTFQLTTARPNSPDPSPAYVPPPNVTQTVGPLARAILGPNLIRVAEQVEGHISHLLRDVVSIEEAEEIGRLATRWLRGLGTVI